MTTFKALRGAVLAACVAVGLLAVLASEAMALAPAAPIYLCISNTAGGAVESGGTTAGSCKAKTTQVALPKEAAEQEKLLAVLPYIKYQKQGVDKKPTIQFSGANLQVLSGAGKEATLNGEGNLIVGYDEGPGTQTGSNNLVLGSKETDTSYGSLLGGEANTDSGPLGDVFGDNNKALGIASSVSGTANTAIGEFSVGRNVVLYPGASVSGGDHNTARGPESSVSGGEGNVAEGLDSSVSGGLDNEAADDASVSGGQNNRAFELGWVGGGEENLAEALRSSVSGGFKNTPAANSRR
jgi:hypothetical protein